MKKGILNGPATIFVNDKKLCRSTFSDQIEFIQSKNHPVGSDNLISSDLAAINCSLVVISVSSLLMVLTQPDLSPLWISIGVLFYIV